MINTNKIMFLHVHAVSGFSSCTEVVLPKKYIYRLITDYSFEKSFIASYWLLGFLLLLEIDWFNILLKRQRY